MIYMNCEMFKYVDRGCSRTLLLIPGWAADVRVFDNLALDFNYILSFNSTPFTFKGDLLNYLKKNSIKKISLFGWSLGGFLAVEFASAHKDMVDKLMLAGVRRKYKKSEIIAAREGLRKNKRGYLIKFYNMCFPDREKARPFKESLMNLYCDQFSTAALLDSLSYLEEAEMIPAGLEGINEVKVIHGELDRIAPLEEAKGIARELKNSSLVIVKGQGHMPFYSSFPSLLQKERTKNAATKLRKLPFYAQGSGDSL
jgi:pimeloyl-ACP methyl ester carboxylesterase